MERQTLRRSCGAQGGREDGDIGGRLGRDEGDEPAGESVLLLADDG